MNSQPEIFHSLLTDVSRLLHGHGEGRDGGGLRGQRRQRRVEGGRQRGAAAQRGRGRGIVRDGRATPGRAEQVTSVREVPQGQWRRRVVLPRRGGGAHGEAAASPGGVVF